MAKCPKCGSANPAKKKFCGECGAEIHKKKKVQESKNTKVAFTLTLKQFITVIIVFITIVACVLYYFYLQEQHNKAWGIEQPSSDEKDEPRTPGISDYHAWAEETFDPYCGDGYCDSDEDYLSCPSDCEPILPQGTPQYINIHLAAIENWDARPGPDGIKIQLKVYDRNDQEIAVSGSASGQLEVTCYSSDYMQTQTAVVQDMRATVSLSDFAYMVYKLTGAQAGVTGEFKLPFSSPWKVSEYCTTGKLTLQLQVKGKTYHAETTLLLP
jgi:predicted nucleic acid-binding Zn ribbon protein